MTHRQFIGISLSIATILAPSFLFAIAPITATPKAEAATLSTLEKKKKELEKIAAQKEAEAKRQADIKAKAESTIKKVGGQITELQGDIQTTQGDIVSTSADIEQKNQEVATQTSELQKIKNQQDLLLRQMYIMRASLPDSLMLFSDQPVSDREKEQAQFSSLKKSVSALYIKTTAAKLEVEQKRADLVKHSEDLARLRDQQDEQKQGLASYQQTQASLKKNAEATMQQLEAEALKVRKQIVAIESQISAALSEAIRNSAKGIYGTGPGVGQRVKAGAYVGIQGATGNSYGSCGNRTENGGCGAHVHFEVRANDIPVNPVPYVNNGTLSWPLKSFVVTQEFGKTQWSYMYPGGRHPGRDIAGPDGSPVYAPADGTVILNQWYGGYGHAWAMQLDNGLVVLLGHMR